MTKYQKNLATVLPRILKLVEDDEDFAEYLVDCLEIDLDEWASNDGFGTERQCDPRGDFRNQEWSLYEKVQQ